MSRSRRWSPWSAYTPAAKKPPPERGIKMQKIGATWWGQRWIEALEEVLQGGASRLARGRTYARAGRTHDLVVDGGRVTAKVTGSRASPYKITIQLTQLSDAAWKDAISAMVARAQFAAELLGGQMPKEIDEVFRTSSTSLFPQRRAELATSCSCPDWGDPCKHVAATHYVLGEALDRDPFLLFELRGRTKTQVLDALRTARAGDQAFGADKGRSKKVAKAADSEKETPTVPTVTFAKLTSRDYDRAPEALPSLQFSFEAPTAHGAVLQQLGVPRAWRADGSPTAALGSLVRDAAEAARRIAMAEPVMPDDEDAPHLPSKRGRVKAPAKKKDSRATPRAAKPRL